MSASLATCLCVAGILGLFYLNRDSSIRTSRALWIAVIWFWILGSRPVTSWLGIGASGPMTVEAIDDGSPTDAAITLALMLIGLAVLAGRGRKPLSVLAANWPIILYFAYGLASLMWSDVPGIGMKRWIKALGDIIMALVVLTDAQPVAALQRLFSRLGLVLLPISELMIRYYPNLGRGFDMWGTPSNVGVTVNKNALGAVAFVLTLGAAWQILSLWRRSTLRNRSPRLIVQIVILASGILILREAHSATAGTACTIAGGLLVLTTLRGVRGRPRTVNALVLSLVLAGALIKVTGFDDEVIHAIGRNPDLTGRASELWPILITMAPNAAIGAGFESFWTGPRMQSLWDRFPTLHVNESHNGYIEVYLNLGAIGLTLLAMMFIHGWRRSLAALRSDPESGSLMLAYLVAAALYSYTEAGFRILFYPWSFLLMMIMGASRISSLASESGKTRGRGVAARNAMGVHSAVCEVPARANLVAEVGLPGLST